MCNEESTVHCEDKTMVVCESIGGDDVVDNGLGVDPSVPRTCVVDVVDIDAVDVTELMGGLEGRELSSVAEGEGRDLGAGLFNLSASSISSS